MSASPASFSPEPASVVAARRYAAGLLPASTVRHLEDDVRTVVSELATNAVLHARTPFTITVLVDGAGVRVAVTDGSPTRPRLPRRGALSDTTGRGLRIVARLSANWGVDMHDNGKTTWCLRPATAPSGPTDRSQDDTGATQAPSVDGEAERWRSLSPGQAGGAASAAGHTANADQVERAAAA